MLDLCRVMHVKIKVSTPIMDGIQCWLIVADWTSHKKWTSYWFVNYITMQEIAITTEPWITPLLTLLACTLSFSNLAIYRYTLLTSHIGGSSCTRVRSKAIHVSNPTVHGLCKFRCRVTEERNWFIWSYSLWANYRTPQIHGSTDGQLTEERGSWD